MADQCRNRRLTWNSRSNDFLAGLRKCALINLVESDDLEVVRAAFYDTRCLGPRSDSAIGGAPQTLEARAKCVVHEDFILADVGASVASRSVPRDLDTRPVRKCLGGC